MRTFIALILFATVCLAQSPYSAINGFDATAAKARADEQKGNTIVVKELWLGMPIEDACQTINHRIGTKLLSVTTDKNSKLKTIVIPQEFGADNEVEVLADASGQVTSFLLSKDILDALFDSKDMPQDEFFQTFINAYNIPELKSEVRELKVWNSEIGFQKVYTYRSPKGFEITFFGEVQREEGTLTYLGLTDYQNPGSMLLKKIKTGKERESKFD